jgi:hypothetical protein
MKPISILLLLFAVPCLYGTVVAYQQGSVMFLTFFISCFWLALFLALTVQEED